MTLFKGWRVFDHVHHLNVSDLRAAEAAADPEGFRARRRTPPPGAPVMSLGPDGPPDIPPGELLRRWRAGIEVFAGAMAALPQKARIPWYGPDMSVRAFIIARVMETWAHGQTIHDALGLTRAATDRLKPICELGWRTLSWTFRVRGLEPPDEPIALRLTAPSGEVWTWGAEEAQDMVEGTAEDFALTVCQCRNVADTDLQVRGGAAKAWMAVAQCFAGGAVDPPPPGIRGSGRQGARR